MAGRRTSARWVISSARMGVVPVTFLVADLDPATQPAWTGPAAARLRSALETAVAARGGERGDGHRDGLVAYFASASDALAAATAVLAVDELAAHVRVALHTGEQGDGRHSIALRRTQRLRDVAGAGQVVLSARTAAEVGPAALRDQGVHRLRDLSPPERIYALGAPGALRSLNATKHNLPVQLSSFVGRQQELVALHRLLAHERLVTLVGPGGAGKTRLAAHALADQAGRWSDGIWWVELGALTGGVAEAVAATLDVLVEPVQGPLVALGRHLRSARLIVCLDNCEHLLDEARAVARLLLSSCAEVAVVTTSREPLGVPGEVVWRVPPLVEEDAQWLLSERGASVVEDSLRRLCARLDGLPLALELAAAWLQALTPAEVDAGLDDRFALLVRGPDGASERQRTLAASISWSYDLLDEDDRALFRRLAVFPASFDVAAGQAVGGALDGLARLVDKSLLVAEQSQTTTRYRMLESIRAFAWERLVEAGEADAARDRHLQHFLALAEQAAPLLDSDKETWRTLMEGASDNLRSALDWGLAADDPSRGRRLAAELPWMWQLGRHGPSGIKLLRRAVLCAPDDRSLLQARLLLGIALVADTAAPLELEYDAAQHALELATEHRDERLRAMALGLAAVGCLYTDPDGADRLAGKAIRAAEGGGEPFMLAASRGLQAIILSLRDRHDEAEPIFSSSIEELLSRGERGVASSLLTFQASGALAVGDSARARILAERAVDVAAPLADYHRVGMARSALALVLGATGDAARGRDVLAPITTLVDGADRKVFVPGMARALGSLALWRDDFDEALRWLEIEPALADTYLDAQALPALATALRSLGRRNEARVAAEQALTLARSLQLPRTIAEALDELAFLSDPRTALELHHEALAIRIDHGLRAGYPASLEALSRLAPPEHGARLAAAAAAGRRELGLTEAPGSHGTTELSLDEAVSYARRSRGRRDRPATGWASLTDTEASVVALAVEGLSNPQIGQRLFMSRHTVKTHLSHVYAKLGASNRTELAAAAAHRTASRS